MRNFQGIIFIWIWIYREIFKSALVYLSKTNEESKDFPNLKNCNCIVFFTIHVFSIIKRPIPYEYDIVFSLEKLYWKSLRCGCHFVMYHLEERSVSTAIRYKKCAQIICLERKQKPYPVCVSQRYGKLYGIVWTCSENWVSEQYTTGKVNLSLTISEEQIQPEKEKLKSYDSWWGTTRFFQQVCQHNTL